MSTLHSRCGFSSAPLIVQDNLRDVVSIVRDGDEMDHDVPHLVLRRVKEGSVSRIATRASRTTCVARCVRYAMRASHNKTLYHEEKRLMDSVNEDDELNQQCIGLYQVYCPCFH